MSDARRARAERRAAIASRVVQTAPVGGRPCRFPSPAVNAATGPAGNEQQASSQHPSVRRDGRIATPSLTPAGSSSHALRAPLEARVALIAANELLRYHPVDDVYEEWLDHVAELVRAAGGSPAPSAPLRRTPPRMGNEAPGAFQPPPFQEDAMAPRRAAPGRKPLRHAPAQQERSCQEVPRPQEGARALPAPARRDPAPAPARQDPALLPAAAQGDPQGQALPQPKPPTATAGCRAYTPELRSVAWPGKFKPDLPPRYDGTTDPTEFLQLYELGIEAASRDEKVMANWFPMALKEGARTWLLNLAPGTISSWEQMRTRFIANSQGTRDRPPAVSDMPRIKQQPGETLQKYIQRFNSARLKIPKVSEEAIISAFSDGVRDIKMKEELVMHEDLCTSLELFNLETKCSRAEEGRLALLELPAADPEEKKPKAKGVKRKGAAVLAAEPDTKRGKDLPESSRGSRYCVYHDLHTHNTNEC